MKPSCTDCWKLILGRYNSFFSPLEESWIQTSLATSSCHGKTKQISAPDTCVYSVCVQCVCTVCVLLTTGMGSCSTLGCDSARSLVCLSQRAPSRNSPLMYTPECHAHNTETISGTEILASPEPSVPWLPCLLALPEPVKPLWTKLNAPLCSVTVFSERHVSCPINSLGGARFGDSWQSVTHTHTHAQTHCEIWSLAVNCRLCYCDEAPAGDWLRVRHYVRVRLRISEQSWRHSEGLTQAGMQTRRGEDLLQLTRLYSVRLMSGFVSSHTHRSFHLRLKTLAFNLFLSLSFFFYTPGHLTNQKPSLCSAFTI